MLVKNKTILLTGASSGIGEALAYELSARGARLFLLARDMERLEKVKSQCSHPELHHCYRVDLLDYHQAAAKTLQILKNHQKIDILINNAGISQRSYAKDTDISVDEKLMAVDYFAPVAMTKALLPHWLQSGHGQVVTVSSIAGIIATPYRSGYAGAKHAIIGFMDSLRAESYQQNLVVTMLCPGFIKTGISVNALIGDGSTLGSVDKVQANGMEPAICARLMVNAIEKDKAMALMGGKERFAVLLNRIFPALVRRIMRTAKVR
ncbi:MAG: short chain dehydrogenase [Gammaproteobacteria bacterium CG22_combo_CG10-13_8_21_14_all_40_8]|nr:MAG: short chain dehydrogenase [Gammaproteobacteria bacterium CG22_combo_CG10-13_8_21_14_all_40_8]